jgi:hypothetical protein
MMAESSSGVVAAAKQTGNKRASCKFTIKSRSQIYNIIYENMRYFKLFVP